MVDLVKDSISSGSFDEKKLNENKIFCSRRLTKKEIKITYCNFHQRYAAYNFRYFVKFKCLIFWGDKKDINLGLVGDLTRILKIQDPELIISFFDGEDGKTYLARDLKLDIYKDKRITSPFGKLSSPMLHMIACQKMTFNGLGSRKLKCGMPLTKYKQLRMTSE
jgi:hypothetical protein